MVRKGCFFRCARKRILNLALEMTILQNSLGLHYAAFKFDIISFNCLAMNCQCRLKRRFEVRTKRRGIQLGRVLVNASTAGCFTIGTSSHTKN